VTPKNAVSRAVRGFADCFLPQNMLEISIYWHRHQDFCSLPWPTVYRELGAKFFGPLPHTQQTKVASAKMQPTASIEAASVIVNREPDTS
jgi:hypothetical protein